MTLPNAYLLAGDSEFRLLTGYSYPPRPGRIKAIEATGQLRIELDDPDGGDALAWPLNGLTYGVDDLVYVLFAANSPDSAIVVGARSLAPVRLDISTLRARNASGLRLEDDAGNLGLLVADGGNVNIGGGDATPDTLLNLWKSAASASLSLTRDSTAYQALTEMDTARAPSATDPRYFYGLRDTVKYFAFGRWTGANLFEDLVIDVNGNIGINTSTPQGRVHALGAAGGMLHWSHAAVSNTAVTILPDGTGDVTRHILMLVVVDNGGSVAANLVQINNNASTDIVAGTGTWRFAVSAAGALTVQRISGTGTAKVSLLACWI